jgi:hypothetical protein
MRPIGPKQKHVLFRECFSHWRRIYRESLVTLAGETPVPGEIDENRSARNKGLIQRLAAKVLPREFSYECIAIVRTEHEKEHRPKSVASNSSISDRRQESSLYPAENCYDKQQPSQGDNPSGIALSRPKAHPPPLPVRSRWNPERK